MTQETSTVPETPPEFVCAHPTSMYPRLVTNNKTIVRVILRRSMKFLLRSELTRRPRSRLRHFVERLTLC